MAAAVCAMVANGAFALPAKADAPLSISVQCTNDTRPVGDIVRQQADMLCSAARATLTQFIIPENAPTALRLVITRANDRSAAVQGAWIFANGQERTIAPMQTKFFDTIASPALHENFMQVFFKTNPLPSAP